MGEKKGLGMILRFGAWVVCTMELSFIEGNVLGEQVWKVKPGIWFWPFDARDIY